MTTGQPVAAAPADQPNEDAARAEALNGPMRRVLAGEWTPRQADEAWETADVLPYPKALPGGVSALAWSLPLAVAWIATRRSDMMEAVALRSEFWGERVAWEPAEAEWTLDLATAREHLEAALIQGAIEARGKRGPFDRRSAIAPLEWEDLAVAFADGSMAQERGLRGLAPPTWSEIRLNRDDVLMLWPATAAEAGAPAGAAPPGLADSTSPSGLGLTDGSSSRHKGPAAAEPPPAGIGEVAAVPTDRTERRAAKAFAIKRAEALMASAPGGKTLPELRTYIQQRETLLSRDDIDGIKHLYPDIRRPGDNARTRVARKSPK